ncbi:MAG TPA: SIS domain-containing protein [Candidatus Acidoferrales bacterium]|nr:SIS domain-containing protein [Candidatus Acidoferrales bacterium]
MSSHIEEIREQLRESAAVRERFSEELFANIERFAEVASVAISRGKKIVFFGNGGSAADAQHLAAELVVRLKHNRAALPGLSLTTNTSVLTAAGNDFGIESIFSRQIESIVVSGDVLVALSTSGDSPNVIRGVEAGRERGAFVVAMTGDTGGAIRNIVDLLLNVPSGDAQRIQEAHITVGHIVCSLIEKLCCPDLDGKS